jgi:hypothetical protein
MHTINNTRCNVGEGRADESEDFDEIKKDQNFLSPMQN